MAQVEIPGGQGVLVGEGGTQHNKFIHTYIERQVIQSREAVSVVSVAAPLGQRDDRLPIRGRDGLLSELVEAGPRVWVVHGLGGCGKTRVALEAAFGAQQRGIEVWWVSAADSDALVAGMRAVGRRLGVAQEDLERADAADVIWQQLGARRAPWLLVIDNADDPQTLAGGGDCVADGRGWLRPISGQIGRVLVTSRDGSAVSWGSWCHRHRLGMLPAREAAEVLADHAGHDPRLGSEDDAQMLAVRLGGLPLALKIAASYLANSVAIPAAFADAGTISTYQSYRQALDAGELETVLVEPGGQMTEGQAFTLIGRIWELTLERLDARQLPEGRRVLQMLATFAHAPVPYELLLRPDTLAASPIFSGITGTRLWLAITALNDFGLLDLIPPVQGSAEIGIIRLPPLVRDTSRSAAGSRDRIMFLELVAHLLDQATASHNPDDPAMWSALQLLAPHSNHVFQNLSADPQCPDGALMSAATAASVIANYRSEQGLHDQAEAGYREVLAAQAGVLGADHSTTLFTRYQMANEMAKLGDHAGAEAEFREVLAAELRTLGPDHWSTLGTRHQLAHQMAARGDQARAEAEFREVLAVQARLLGPDDQSTLASRHCLASALAENGDHAASEAEYREVLAAQLRTLGPDHSFTLNTRHQLAHQMAARGDHVAAEAEHRDVVAARARLLGPDHRLTLATRACLAEEIADRGDHAAAEAEYRQVLATRLRLLGPDHSYTLDSRYRMAHEMAACGDHAGAEAEFREVLAAEMRTLGPDDPSTLATRHEIAHQMAACGDHAGAEAEFREVLAAELRTLGPDDPSTLASRGCLASALAEHGDYAAAEAEYRELLGAQVGVLGPEDPSTLATRSDIANVYWSTGRLGEAISMYQSVLADCEQVLGPRHPLTEDIRATAADALAQVGRLPDGSDDF